MLLVFILILLGVDRLRFGIKCVRIYLSKMLFLVITGIVQAHIIGIP